jgi:SAM-dependent methyltransferase
MPVDELRRHYPELRNRELVPVDIVDDGECLASIPDGSQDFLVANHLIEHTENPLGALSNWLRVLRSGGTLYLAVPHKAHTFDRDRTPTSLAHVLKDYEEGSAWSRREHYEEWARIVNKVDASRLEESVERLMKREYSIHFHVWTDRTFRELLEYARDRLSFGFTLERFQPNGMEFIVVLSKR